VKITRVEAIPLAIPFTYGADAFKLGTGSWKKLDFCLVRVETDAGLVGWGDAFAYTCRAAVAAAVTARKHVASSGPLGSTMATRWAGPMHPRDGCGWPPDHRGRPNSSRCGCRRSRVE